MKLIVTLVFALAYFSMHAQKKESYYDVRWKSCKLAQASFYSVVEKTDSGWLRDDYFIGSKSIQMEALYEDADCKVRNGNCYYFFANNQLEAMGRLIHNKEEGPYVRYYSNGMTADSAFYHNGITVGSRIKWHRNGFMSDSIYHINDSMDVQISWFDDGSLAAAGYLLRNKPSGKWKYYHLNGSLSAEETYDKGTAISKIYYDEKGALQNDTSEANKEAYFKNGVKGWHEYIEKNLRWPDLEFKHNGMATVMVEFTIDEQGKVVNEEVVIPFHPAFDKIALEIIHNSPLWNPATAHNRKVKYYLKQPLSFLQE